MSTSALMYDPFVGGQVIGSRFLDVGCGCGKWGFLLKTHRVPAQSVYVAGVDLRRSSVESTRAAGFYDEVQVADARRLPFPDKSFDSVIACEVIEHLPKADGAALMSEAQRCARDCVVVSTPHNAGLRKGYDCYEDHLSSYTLAEFRALGFTQVIGLGRLHLRPWSLSVCLASLGLVWPRLSSQLMGFWFADGRHRSLYAE